MPLSHHRRGSQDATEDCGRSSRAHVKFSEDDLTDEALLAFLQGYAKTSFKGGDNDLTFLGAEIGYQMNLKPFDRVKNIACQCQKIIQTYGLQQVVETEAGKKKRRQVIISKINPKPFSDRLRKALFPMQGNTRRARISSLLRARPDRPSRQRVSIRRVKEDLNPPHQAPLLLARSQGIRGSRWIKAEVMHRDDSSVEVRITWSPKVLTQAF